MSKELILAEDIVSRNSLHTGANRNNLNAALVLFLLGSFLVGTQPRTGQGGRQAMLLGGIFCTWSTNRSSRYLLSNLNMKYRAGHF